MYHRPWSFINSDMAAQLLRLISVLLQVYYAMQGWKVITVLNKWACS